MEETDVCHSIPVARALQQAIPNHCTGKTLGAGERLCLGVQALAGHQTITGLAEQANVSRKFVYQQADRAQTALDDAFASTAADDQVLFHLPITKNWLKQVALGLTLICHSSYRGVHEFCRDLLDVNMAVGTAHNIVHDAIDKARPHNSGQNLANVDIAGLDEIFQKRQPVLVGADIRSTYCFLLSAEDQRGRRAMRGQTVDKFGGHGARVSFVRQTRFFGQGTLVQPVEQSKTQASENAYLRKMSMRIYQAG